MGGDTAGTFRGGGVFCPRFLFKNWTHFLGILGNLGGCGYSYALKVHLLIKKDQERYRIIKKQLKTIKETERKPKCLSYVVAD